MNNYLKINLGAGNDIRQNYLNHDIVKLSKIDVVHDLNVFPWPWGNDSCQEILMKDVLEHLDNPIKALEELHRILVVGGTVHISVPYWNSANAHIDPTHRKGFHEHTFHFFDPRTSYCQERPYYSKARFEIKREVFIISPFVPYIQMPGLKMIRIENHFLKRIIGIIGNTFSNIILDLIVEMKKLDSNEKDI